MDDARMVASASAAWRQWWLHRPDTTALTAAARRQGFVLTVPECGRLGVSTSAVRTAVRRGRWFRAAAGVVCPFDLSVGALSDFELLRRQHAVSVAAAVLRRPDHTAVARSAAVLHGLPTRKLPDLAELGAPNADGLGRQSPSHAYGARLSVGALQAWHGVAVTNAARTVVDLARHDRWDGLMAVDAALREGLCDMAELALELDDGRGWPGIRQARDIIGFADPLSESPLESVVRLALHDSGFPPPQLQCWIGPDRVDFLWPKLGLVVEADGRGKYDKDALWAEKKREHRLRQNGVTAVERVIWSDVFPHWSLTEARLRPNFVTR